MQDDNFLMKFLAEEFSCPFPRRRERADSDGVLGTGINTELME
jgi:hypothetical protein